MWYTIRARLWTRDADQSEIYAEEWHAIVVERPGKLFKLGSALGFLGLGVWRSGTRHVAASWLRRGTPIANIGRIPQPLGLIAAASVAAAVVVAGASMVIVLLDDRALRVIEGTATALRAFMSLMLRVTLGV